MTVWYLGFLKFIPKQEERKEGNVLFNDVLNTFYLWLYGVGSQTDNINF